MNHDIPVKIQQLLTTVFSGLEIKPEKAIGGVLFSVRVWEYTFDVRVVTDKIAKTDVEGLILLSFRRKSNTHTEIIDTTTTMKTEDAEAFAEKVKATLLGINAAIEQAFMPPSPADLC